LLIWKSTMLAVSAEFFGLAAVVAVAGTFLARSADQIAEITRLGRLLVGSVLLAAATSLPELTVDLSAVRQGHPDLAIGDLFGSSLMNLMILAVLDLSHQARGIMLSRQAAAHALSGTLSIGLTAMAGMALLTAPRLPHWPLFGIGLWPWAILAVYLLGIRLIFLDQRMAASASAPIQSGFPQDGHSPTPSGTAWVRPFGVFAISAIVLVLAGPRLAHSANELATLSGLGRTFVGTTLVALCTSLPELVASITALRMKSFDLVIGNIFGSNAFNMVLLVPLDAAHPGSLLAAAASTHAVTSLAVIAATTIAILGQLYHLESRRRFVEPDGLLLLVVLAGSLFLIYHLSI
jgi:cation:H+ antiporter